GRLVRHVAVVDGDAGDGLEQREGRGVQVGRAGHRMVPPSCSMAATKPGSTASAAGAMYGRGAMREVPRSTYPPYDAVGPVSHSMNPVWPTRRRSLGVMERRRNPVSTGAPRLPRAVMSTRPLRTTFWTSGPMRSATPDRSAESFRSSE